MIYYDRVPLVINAGYAQDSRRDALRNILRVVPYGIAVRRWGRTRIQIIKKYTAHGLVCSMRRGSHVASPL